MAAVPRQRKFNADLAVINECLNELIDLVGRVRVLACERGTGEQGHRAAANGTAGA